MLTLANPFENVPSRSFFPRQGKADGRAGRGRGAGEGDMGVINENSLAPPQIFHPILTLSLSLWSHLSLRKVIIRGIN